MSAVFTRIDATRRADIFIFADHASNYIPTAYDNLGLERMDLERHIASDIGTKAVTSELAHMLGCGAHIAAFSRLLVDPNRAPQAPDLIVKESDGTPITGNHNLLPAERMNRMESFYTPYHQGLHAAFTSFVSPCLIISVHSFTPALKTGVRRLTDIGLLVKHDPVSADILRTALQACKPDWRIEINQPYSACDLNYSIDYHVAPRGWPHLAIEIRQDHIDTSRKVVSMTQLLHHALRAFSAGS